MLNRIVSSFSAFICLTAMAFGSDSNAAIGKVAREIKSSPLYRDTGTNQSSNWLATALSRLANLFKFKLPQGSGRVGNAPDLSVLGIIIKYAVMGLLAVAIGVFLYFVIKHFSWQRSLKRKASALMEEDEPARTADEWLRLADGLTQQGRYREAVRCLYLACLLRYDEAGVARFNRSETNWEHLARIQASPKRPPALNFLPQTQAFDTIWYGHHVRGIEDVDQFRIWYGETVFGLQGIPT